MSGKRISTYICIVDKIVVDGSTETLNLVNKGRIAESKVNFADVETLATPVGPANNQKTIKDWLNDLGIIFEGGMELTKIDNQ